MKIYKFNIELDKKTLLRSLRSCAYFAVSFFLIFYLIYHASNGFQSKLETEAALYSVGEKNVTLDAYIFRDESVITSNYDGIVSYLAEENEKVTDTTVVANIYQNGTDVSLIDEIAEIDRQISILSEVSASSMIFTDIASIDNSISKALSDVNYYITTGDVKSAISGSDALLSALSKRQLRMDSKKNFFEYIDMLSQKKAALSLALPHPIQSVRANSQGYFSSRCDGYEEYFDFDKVEALSVTDFFKMRDDSQNASLSHNTVGKIISSFEWYLVCPIEHNLTGSFSIGKEYSISFIQNMNITLPALLERIATDNSEGSSLLIFKCTRMPSDFNYLRQQKITVCSETVSGLKIPRSSVRVVDQKTFVYILVGGRVYMRSVTIKGDAGEYYYVSENGESVEIDGKEYYPLKQNDNVIVYGTNLFNGKIYK